MEVNFYNDEESLEWAKEVHGLPVEAKSFVIDGNEDPLSRIVWYPVTNPKYTDEGTEFFPTYEVDET